MIMQRGGGGNVKFYFGLDLGLLHYILYTGTCHVPCMAWDMLYVKK